MDSPVDKAFARYFRLFQIIEKAQKRATSNPTDQYNVEIGILEQGERLPNAKQKIAEAFEELGQLIDYVAILDMCSSFEEEFRKKIATARGEARKSVKDHYKLVILKDLCEKFVCDGGKNESLSDFLTLIKGHLPPETSNFLDEVRSLRNNFAHGKIIYGDRPPMTLPDVRDNLNQIIKDFLK